jgi:ATP-dependent helicase/nuclease subunit A
VDFEPHTAEHMNLPGHVAVLPLAVAESVNAEIKENAPLILRNPLTSPRDEKEEGARQKEAAQFAGLLQTIESEWSVIEKGKQRRATYGDIMVLVRSRTHLAVYEEALRARHIPFLTSRRGGLLDTLEAKDIQALLTFLITPFADLALAQVLRTPVFACSDDDLMQLASSTEGHWWVRLQRLEQGGTSAELQRAHRSLQGWLALADKLPVHDLLDRIYFEGDVLARYAAVLPPEMRAKVVSNLHAFMEIALSVDAGRYPSLPRFLQELSDLRDSTDDAPDEGKLGTAGDAVRIYTIHEAKGLQAPIVWLLDANAEGKHREGNDVLLDWPTYEQKPLHFSLYTDLSSRGKKRVPLFEQDAAQQAREEMNLLYVAMTRAQQALIVSGNSKGEDKEEKKKAMSWYDRIAAGVIELRNPLRNVVPASERQKESVKKNVALPAIVSTGKRAARDTMQQQRGTWLHALLQYLVPPREMGDKAELQVRCAIPAEEMDALWQQAQALLARAPLQRFFDPQHYRSANNEMSYVNAQGELKRIDRLVEFEDEVWVLDYKLSDAEDAARYRVQMLEYRAAMQSVYAGKKVRCALVFADGVVNEM